MVEPLRELGLTRAVGGFGPDDFTDMDAVRRTAEICQDLIESLAAESIELALHNHWWEFELVDGQPAYHHLQKLVPGLRFELDTYWAANFGACNPADELSRIRSRTPLLHIKDGPLRLKESHVAVGSGRMDIAGVISAADPETLEWLIVELDACDSNMMTAVRESYRYQTQQQLARGRNQ